MSNAAHGSDGARPKSVYEPVAKLEAFYTGGAVRVTRNNQHMACACGDEVKVMDLATGTVTRTLPGDSEPITCLALSPDKHSLVAASRSLSVRLWDWTSGECKRTWKPHRAPVADMAVDASGGFLATGSSDRSLKVTDLAGGFVTHHFTGHSGIVLRVLFHPRQLMLFSSDDQGEVRVWDLVTKAPAFKNMAKGHMSAVPALCLAPDGWHLLSGGRDKVVCVWDIRNGSRVATLPVYEALEGLAVLPTGSAFPGVLPVDSLIKQGLSSKAHFFATAGERGVVRIWRSDTGTCVYTYSGSSSCLLGSSGSSGGSGGSGGSSGSTKKRQKTALGAAEVVAAAAGSELLELMLLPGGKGLLAATGDARLLFFHPKVEDAAAGSSGSSSKVSDLSLTRQLVGNFDEITDLAFVYNTGSSSSSNDEDPGQQQQQRTAADGSTAAGLVLQPHEPRRLAVATNSHDIRLFELADASCVGDFVGHRDIVVCLDTVRPAAGIELLASGAKDSEVRVWDTATGTCLAVAAGHVATVTAVAWSRSKAKAGRYLATGGADKLLKLWDTAGLLDRNAGRSGPVSLSTVAAIAAHGKDVNGLAFSPNDSLLATSSQDKSIKLWRLPSLVVAHTLRGHKRGVWDLAFSPSEQVLVSCSSDKLLKLWSVVDGTCLRTFEGHTGGVLRCSFLTAGTQVMSSGADGLLKLWDTRTATDLATFESHDNRLWGLALSSGPDESLVATGGDDSRVVVWRDVTADKAAAAEAEEEELALKQQELSNALADGDYAVAARLAFQLRHPGRLLEVLRRQPGGPTAALSALQALVGDLSPEDLATALAYCREWNTNTRNAHLAQVLLRAVLSQHTPAQILAVPGAGELVGGLLAYSQRHASRLDRLLRSTFLLDYTLAASQVLLPADAHDAATDAAAADAAAAAAAGAAGGEALGGGGGHHGKMNGLANGHHDVSNSSSDDFAGDDSSDQGATSGSDVGSEDEDMQEAAAGSKGQQQQQQQGRRVKPSAAAAAAAAPAAAPAAAAADDDDDEASRPDPKLPGWGGGDDLSDGWEGPGDDVMDDAHDIIASDDDVMASGDDDDDVMASGDGASGSEGQGGSSSEGEGVSGELAAAAAADSDSSGDEEEESEDLQQQQQQQQQQQGKQQKHRGPGLKQQQQQVVVPQRQAAAGQQRAARQQQQQQPGASTRGAAGAGPKHKGGSAATAAKGSPAGSKKGGAAGIRSSRRLKA